MTTDGIRIVSDLRDELARRIGRERFDLWFQTGVRLAVNGGVITVGVSDQFILERLRKQFLIDLREAGSQLMGLPPQVEFLVDESLRAKVEELATAAPSRPVVVAAEAASALPTPSDSRPRTRRRFASLNTYVIGDANRLAFTAARSVTERPGSVSPLYLHGPTGCGKTHLLEGIWSAMRHRYRTCRALYLSSEQFTSHFLDALHGGGLPGFRRKTRDVDVLLIDDVQFFAGKRATIVELQNTMDALVRGGRQLVLAGDRPPNALTELGPEFGARVSGGLVCWLDAGDYATRLGIAAATAARIGLELPDDVQQFIANEIAGDGRLIAGALHRLRATSEAQRQPITLDLAASALQDILHSCHQVVQLGDIEKAVCTAFGVSPELLRDERKSKSVSHPRMLAMWLARKHTRAASSEISNFFGRRSHSTVISAEKKVNGWVENGVTVQVGSGCYRANDAIRRAELQLRSG